MRRPVDDDPEGCAALLVTSWFVPMPAPGLFIVVAFLSTYLLCACVVSVLDAGVVTVLVCFAEDPGALHSSRPAVHHDLVQAWAQIYPDEMVACGYITKADCDEI